MNQASAERHDERADGHHPWHDHRRGSRPGDVYVRLARHRGFRWLAPGRLEVREGAADPRSGLPRLLARVKRALVGEPIATAAASHERLTRPKALAVLSSDALSSVAYATEEIMKILLLAGTVALGVSLPIAGGIVLLLLIVGSSYRQTVKAYPKGGGSYIVAKDNLGTLPGLTAAASLLVSYVLTVSVSITAALLALTSAYPPLAPWLVPLGTVVIVLITTINLRGIRESGTIFMIPTYAFLVCIGALLVVGLARFGLAEPLPPREIIPPEQALTLFLALRAFASGGAALTGLEAISDGVPAFQPPEWKNARTTLTWMIVLLAITFGGITFLAHQLGIVPNEHETVISQIARAVFGEGPLYLAVQVATMLILVLAANTAYADFPRLSYFLARDGFMPRQFTFRGDRLAYSTGIIALGVFSVLVLWLFGGSISALIPLYAFGVFSAFTFSQAGMVVRWWRRREPGWPTSIILNGVGAATTLVVLLVVATTKFLDGAWLAIILLPLQIAIFRLIHRHYQRAASQLAPAVAIDPAQIVHHVIVPVSRLNQASLQTLAYARSIARAPGDSVTAVNLVEDGAEAEAFGAEWEAWAPDVPLVQIESPYRSLVGPLLAYVEAVQRREPRATVSVVLPEFVPSSWWEHLLHNQTALRLKGALLFRPGVVVTSVPYHLRKPGLASIDGDGESEPEVTEPEPQPARAYRVARRPKVVKPSGRPGL